MSSLQLPFSPNLDRIPTYSPGRPIDEVARELGLPPGDIIKLASNENPLGPSPAALAAMERSLKTLHLYPDGNAFHLKRRLAAKLGLQPENLILGNGSNEIIEFAGHALLGPGAEVVVSQYCFAVYPIVTRLFGANLVTVPARNHGHDLPAMLRAITPRTRIVFAANPNNPTGTLAPASEVMALVNGVPPETLLVMDEAYTEFLDAQDRCDLLPLIRSGAKPNLILMRTFSKLYGLAGLRLGYGIGHPDLVAALEKIRQPFNINALVQAGALAALDDEEHVQRTLQNNRAGLAFYEKACQDLGLPIIRSAANFLLIRVGDGARVVQDLQKLGIIVRSVAGYDLPDYIRISVGTPAENARTMAGLRQVLGK
ncbi:MAG: hypothetical protein RJA22_80 [Verrucomicrobiota bacterium]